MLIVTSSLNTASRLFGFLEDWPSRGMPLALMVAESPFSTEPSAGQGGEVVDGFLPVLHDPAGRQGSQDLVAGFFVMVVVQVAALAPGIAGHENEVPLSRREFLNGVLVPALHCLFDIQFSGISTQRGASVSLSLFCCSDVQVVSNLRQRSRTRQMIIQRTLARGFYPQSVFHYIARCS